ncbi:MAG: CHAT domain-containing protein [Phycisphaerae bacterium]|nr:CHAT domain-containing protein [Saprospiraceae bacterium]
MKRFLFFAYVFANGLVLNAQAFEPLNSEKAIYALLDSAETLVFQARIPDAQSLLDVAKAKADSLSGKHSVLYAATMYVEGRILLFKAKYQEAELKFSEALKICLENNDQGRGSMNAYKGLASAHSNLGNYALALTYNSKYKTLALSLYGEKSKPYAVCLNNIGLVYWRQGILDSAEIYLLSSLKIREEVLGKNSYDYSSSLMNLGLVYRKMGRYDQSEKCYLVSADIRKKIMGADHPEYVQVLGNLAVLYNDIGNLEQSQKIWLEVLQIRKKVLGEGHLDYIRGLVNVSNNYLDWGKYDEGLEYLIKAKMLYDSSNLPKGEVYASLINNLGNMYTKTKKYEQAEYYLNLAIEFKAKIHGADNPEYAVSLANLGYLFYNKKDYGNAKKKLFEALQILKIKNPRHRMIRSVLMDILMAQFDSTEPINLELCHDMYTFLCQNLTLFGLIKNERELLNSRNDYLVWEDFLGSCLSAQKEPTGKFAEFYYDDQLFVKNFIENRSAALNRLPELTAPSPLALVYDDWNDHRKKVSDKISQKNIDQSVINTLINETDSLETILVRSASGFAAARQQVSWQEVAQALRPDEAALEFVRFYQHSELPGDTILYAALLLRPGYTSPLFIRLFEKEEIASLMQFAGGGSSNKINALYQYQKGAAKNLYDLIWKPIEPHLSGVKTLYCAPTGLLHRLNLGAIPLNDQAVFSDRYQVILLGSTRQLVVDYHSPVRPATAYLAGGIHYQMDSTSISTANASKTRGIGVGDELEFKSDSSYRGDTWTYLPESKREAQEIAGLLQKNGYAVQLDTGFQATEESFLRLGSKGDSPGIIHVSTHGFFYPDPSGASKNKTGNEPAFKYAAHPLIRTGLVMAGGNQAWKGEPVPEGLEDGILTAYEISRMNLAQTELVVLSACETGLGEIQNNEGVYGLQRAFRIAGVQYIIMSLWKVNDQTTRELMTAFYCEWLLKKQDIPKAFAAAQAQMRKKYAGSPYNWAGFVLLK